MKQIKKGPKETVSETHAHNLRVMMPFIKFSFGAIKVIGHALVYIVKSLPVLLRDKPAEKPSNRIIKIK